MIDFDKYLPTEEMIKEIQKENLRSRKELDGYYLDFLASADEEKFMQQIEAFNEETERIRRN